MAQFQCSILDMGLALEEANTGIELISNRLKLIVSWKNANKGRIMSANERDVRVLSVAKCSVTVALRSGQASKQ